MRSLGRNLDTEDSPFDLLNIASEGAVGAILGSVGSQLLNVVAGSEIGIVEGAAGMALVSIAIGVSRRIVKAANLVGPVKS